MASKLLVVGRRSEGVGFKGLLLYDTRVAIYDQLPLAPIYQ